MLPNTPHSAFDIVRVMRREIYPPEPLSPAASRGDGPAADSGSDGGGNGLLARSVTAWQAAGRALVGFLPAGRRAPGRVASVATADCRPSTGA